MPQPGFHEVVQELKNLLSELQTKLNESTFTSRDLATDASLQQILTELQQKVESTEFNAKLDIAHSAHRDAIVGSPAASLRDILNRLDITQSALRDALLYSNVPSFQTINIATAGDNPIIPGSAGQRIYVVSLMIQNAGTTDQTVLIKDGATTELGRVFLAASSKQGIVLDRMGYPIVTSPGNDFILNLSAADSVYGMAVYVKA